MKFVSTLICLIQLSVAPLLCADTSSLERPNILWLTSEDNSIDWVGCYGNSNAKTPNIDQLAADGFQYMHAYASAPVCAPSRSTWITGINAISMGTHPMRSRYNIPHDLIAYYPDLLRANGYTVGNDKKTDYNIGGRPDADCWDNPKKVNWATLKLEHRQDLDGCRVLINQIVQINPELKEHKLVKALQGDDEDDVETFG